MNISVNDTITISEYATKSPLHFSVNDSIAIEEVVVVGWYNIVWTNRTGPTSAWEQTHRGDPNALWSQN